MESSLRSPDPPTMAGGLIIMVRADPDRAARALAGNLHADLAVGGHETEAALRRLGAAVACGSDRDVDSVTAAMRRAEAVLDRTRAAASQRLSASLNTRLAIHPRTIRKAADELIDAVDVVKGAENGQRQARARRQRFGIATVLVALAVAAVIAVLRPGWGVASAVAAFLVVLGWAIVTREPAHRRFTPAAPAPLLDALAVAHRRWVQVGGAGIDPSDVDAVIHRYDPQDHMVALLADEHPAVRAAERVVLARRKAWVAAWEAKVAPGPGDPEASVDVRVRIDLADGTEAHASTNGNGRPGADALLRRNGAVLWLPEAPNDPTGPASLILAMPYEGLADERARSVHEQLLALPPGERVLVILAPEATIAPRSAVSATATYGDAPGEPDQA